MHQNEQKQGNNLTSNIRTSHRQVTRIVKHKIFLISFQRRYTAEIDKNYYTMKKYDSVDHEEL